MLPSGFMPEIQVAEIALTLPDGTLKTVPAGTTAMAVAEGIGKRLADERHHTRAQKWYDHKQAPQPVNDAWNSREQVNQKCEWRA